MCYEKVMAPAVSLWPPTAGTQRQSQVTFDRHSGKGTIFDE